MKTETEIRVVSLQAKEWQETPRNTSKHGKQGERNGTDSPSKPPEEVWTW